MSFFTDGPRERPLFPVRERELFAYDGRPWMGPPSDHIVPALLPWARPLGRSERTMVALRGVEVWPEALTLRLAVYSLDSLEEGRSGSLIDHRRIPDYNALLVGVLYPGGARASSESISVPSASEPEHPVLRAHGCGGSQFHLDHQVFVWPLPADGPFTVVVQWLDRDVKETHTELDGAAIRAAALEAGELWPGLARRPGNGLGLRGGGEAEEPLERSRDQPAFTEPVDTGPGDAGPGDARPGGAEPVDAGGSGDAGPRASGPSSPLPRRTPSDPRRPTFAPPKAPAQDPLVQVPRFAEERLARLTASEDQPARESGPPSGPWPVELPQPSRRRAPGE